MDRYDVVLVIFSLAAFVFSVAKITAGFTKAISRLETTVEQFALTLAELKQTVVTIRDDNKKAHGEFYVKMESLDRRILRLETMADGN